MDNVQKWMSSTLTIIDYHVCLQTLHDNWQNHVMKVRNHKQIWHALRSANLVVFEILVKKLQVEDTEAFQKMMRMTWETFCKILLAIK